jgi:two-component system, OmpR family, sensor histidine kinase KdpD
MRPASADVSSWLKPTLGALSCSVIAVVLSEFLQKNSFKAALPICFLLVILLVALRFGTMAGTLGTIVATVIFAFYLFEPLHSLEVASQAGRNNLLWMFLGGLVLSDLFGHPPQTPTKPDVRGPAAL